MEEHILRELVAKIADVRGELELACVKVNATEAQLDGLLGMVERECEKRGFDPYQVTDF